MRDGVYVNPLRPGALGPFADTTRPWIKQLRAERSRRDGRATIVIGYEDEFAMR